MLVERGIEESTVSKTPDITPFKGDGFTVKEERLNNPRLSQ